MYNYDCTGYLEDLRIYVVLSIVVKFVAALFYVVALYLEVALCVCIEVVFICYVLTRSRRFVIKMAHTI